MEVLASGREAEVFALDDDRVLRRFRDPARSAGATVGLLDRLTGLGYPVPAVLSWDGHELVQERVNGPRMDEAMTAGALAPSDAGLMLAGLLDRLHALPWGAEPLLHLDLHPQNVLLGDDGPVVIDWSNSRPGPPGLDVAMSGLILAQVAVAEPATYADVVAVLVGTMTGAVATEVVPYVDDAVALRRSDPNMTELELAQMGRAKDLLLSLC
ncbi:MAG TPA: phosphotransferase [Nocardioides sp.]|uniref:phosphotransferase n=1 Tax=Nocardioides sp. TaxID=35761 RepID=UPI002F3E8CC8